MACEVFLADSISACLSSGQVVRGSITSALRPTSSSSLAAPRATATMLLVATMVTSVPARFTSATPKGIVYSSAGTGPFTRYIILSSKMTTGLSSRMAVFIRPLASYGPEGSATLRPGTWLTQACSDCECWAAERRAEDDGHLDLAARHAVRLGGLVDHLIHRQRDEVAEHHVDDRAHARHRGADADAGVARLGDRRVDDPLGAELLDEPREGLERMAGLGHVFADEEHARVAPHLLRDRFLDRLAVRQLSLAHDRPPFICAPRPAGPQPRDGLQRALPLYARPTAVARSPVASGEARPFGARSQVASRLESID